MKNGTYIQLIKFCSSLSIKQLIAYKDLIKDLNEKAYLVSLEVLNIRMSKQKKTITNINLK